MPKQKGPPKQVVSVNLTKELIFKIDGLRGNQSRSAYIEAAIMRGI